MRRLIAGLLALMPLHAASRADRYYAHATVEDRYGVIAPWYKGQNGQFDERVRIAAETLKRYPWVDKSRAPAAGPEYLYNGKWSIARDGTITVLPEPDWNNGDLVQRAANAISAWERYYVYSGDPAAFTHITALADYLVDDCQTDTDHGWPRMLISVPTHGERYGRCRLGSGQDIRQNGKIQLDIVAEAGLALVRAYEMTGNRRWLDTAEHWADLLAQNRHTREVAPWGRYASNGGGKGMTDVMTGGVAFLLTFFDELIRIGYQGDKGAILEARNAGRDYLRGRLLPLWTKDDTWGHNYWDGPGLVQQSNVTEFVTQYMMSNDEYFNAASTLKQDVRNVLGLFLNHASADPASAADTYSGAWAYPESANCCGTSLAYVPMRLAGAYARYAAIWDSGWAREMARRQQILATYDMLDTGFGEDLIAGGASVYASWFKIAHPQALRNVLGTMAWLPDIMGANRENHIMRSSSVIRKVVYGKGHISYEAFDAPLGSEDVLRLAFRPSAMAGDGKPLAPRSVRKLNGGDYLVTIQRNGIRKIEVRGPDPQMVAAIRPGVASSFVGNQVRVIGRTGTSGGHADVYLDGVKQLVPIDCRTPAPMDHQVLYYRSGLENAKHTIRIVPEGEREVMLESIQYSAATGDSGFGEGGGPPEPQGFMFGYGGRKDYYTGPIPWRPGVEYVARTGKWIDTVVRTWMPRLEGRQVSGTSDPELYRYGIHGPELIINVTVGPGTYRARLMFAETEFSTPGERAITIFINGEKKVSGFDPLAAAKGSFKATDLVYDGLRPKNGIIEVRLTGSSHDAILRALEVRPD